MDIDKEITSLERNGIFTTSDSPKLLIVKATLLLLISSAITYIIKPVYILKLKYDPSSKDCGYNILKKRFLVISVVNFVILYLVAYYFNLL